ncbi:MAG TPA: hypothetical protein VEW45_07220 [Candidatus Dormibacteraeota bacterium]|nr:hypothetical protein [Candidatus Dormibacteraeota bacterium]
MPAWLARGAVAARLAGDRADLWPAGALGALVFLGWLPFLLAVAPPNPGDLGLLGAALRGSSAFPANLIALGVAVVSGVMLLCLLAAVAEVALLRTAGASQRGEPPFSRAALVALTVILVAALPAAATVSALLLGAVTIVPGVYQAPDFGAPLAVRLALSLLPFLIALVLAALAGQAFGGVALRRALAPGAPPLRRVLAETGRDLVRHPWGRIGVAAAGLFTDLLMVAISYAVLRILWAPIVVELSAGRLTSPDTLLLLVGFVAIWLGLLLAAGALHVMISAWWALELAPADTAPTGPTVAA